MRIAGIEIITIEVSLLIIGILTFRHLFADRLHPSVMKWLWGIPALRILLPVWFPIEGMKGWSFDLGAGPLALGIWVFGAVFVLVLFLSENAGFKRNVKRQRTLYGKKDGLLVYFVDRRIGSCLVGLVHPQIYVSRSADSSLDWCKWIVKHELCHYQAMDHWYGMLRLLCLVLQWFNPLVWYAAACSIEDLEIACDYQVVKDENPAARISYGKCLIAMAAGNPQRLLKSITTGNALGRGSLKRRIKRLGEGWQMRGALSGLLVSGMLLLLLGCFVIPDNSDSSLPTLLSHVPYVRECILQYELEAPSDDALTQTIDAVRYRCRVRGLKNIGVCGVNSHTLLVLLPPSKALWGYMQGGLSEGFWADIDYIVYGESLSIHTQAGIQELSASQDMFSIERDSQGYSLWLDLEQAAGHMPEEFNLQQLNPVDLADGESRLYLGDNLICAITDENVKGNGLRLYKEESFDTIYDILERICNKNPCELRLSQ